MNREKKKRIHEGKPVYISRFLQFHLTGNFPPIHRFIILQICTEWKNVSYYIISTEYHIQPDNHKTIDSFTVYTHTRNFISLINIIAFRKYIHNILWKTAIARLLE